MPQGPETGTPPALEVLTNERPGADFMTDVIRSLGFEYICSNPGSSFRALHEFILNHGDRNPEFLTCCHEESSVAMAHGYAKIEGKPLCVLAHDARYILLRPWKRQAPATAVGPAPDVGTGAESRTE